MPTCPVCQSTKLKARKTRWWEKVQGRLVWRRECQCEQCGWSGWITGAADTYSTPQVVEAYGHPLADDDAGAYQQA